MPKPHTIHPVTWQIGGLFHLLVSPPPLSSFQCSIAELFPRLQNTQKKSIWKMKETHSWAAAGSDWSGCDGWLELDCGRLCRLHGQGVERHAEKAPQGQVCRRYDHQQRLQHISRDRLTFCDAIQMFPSLLAKDLNLIDKESDDVLERIMDEKTASESKILHGHSGPVYGVSFSPDR